MNINITNEVEVVEQDKSEIHLTMRLSGSTRRKTLKINTGMIQNIKTWKKRNVLIIPDWYYDKLIDEAFFQ